MILLSIRYLLFKQSDPLRDYLRNFLGSLGDWSQDASSKGKYPKVSPAPPPSVGAISLYALGRELVFVIFLSRDLLACR